jgi:hypothetical protein
MASNSESTLVLRFFYAAQVFKDCQLVRVVEKNVRSLKGFESGPEQEAEE